MDPEPPPTSESLLADLTSRDPRRVHAAAWAIIRLRDEQDLRALAAALPDIRRETDGVELAGALFPNRETLNFALRKLEHRRDDRGCPCALYPEFLLLDPRREAEAGHVRIVETTYIDGRWVDRHTCECTQCGAAYEVKEGESHSTWWEWRPSPR